MNLFPTMCSGLERHAEAFAEHTQAGINRILNVSSAIPDGAAATEPRPRVGIAQEGSSSPCADARTASVSDLSGALYRARIRGYERLIDQLHELLQAERFDDATSLVRDEYRAIHGPGF